MENDRLKFILTEDTPGIKSRILKDSNPQPGQSNLDEYYQNVTSILKNALFKNGIGLSSFREKEIEEALVSRTREILRADAATVCLCLDRYLLSEIETDPDFSNRFSRLSICRNTQGERIARQGSGDFDTQLSDFATKLSNLPSLSILLVDDGIFSGGTIEFIADRLSKIGIRNNQLSVLGFIGDRASQKLKNQGITVEIVEEAQNLYDWVDLRDFGIFGGKTLAQSKSRSVASSIPYLFPFSSGEGAGFDKFGNLFTLSSSIINCQIKLLRQWEFESGQSISFRNLIRAGFPFPTNLEKNLNPSLNQRAIDFLTICLSKIEKEQKRKVLIFDMDGVLNILDGSNQTYSGSRLEQAVNTNAAKLLSDQKKVNLEMRPTNIPLSLWTSNQLNITRSEYFQIVWGKINPADVVSPNTEVLRLLKKVSTGPSDTKLILLSNAPRVWVNNVQSFLRTDNTFEAVYSIEDFEDKSQAFRMFSERYCPRNVYSVGDQEATDLEPARALGLNAISVKKSDYLQKLTEII